MMSSRTDRNGARIADRGNRPLSNDVVKLLKTQDIGYVRTMLQKTRKERERAEQEIQILDQQNEDGQNESSLRTLRNGRSGGKGKHTIFVDSKEEQVGFGSANRLKPNGRPPHSRSGSENAVSNEEHDGNYNEVTTDSNGPFDSRELRQIQRAKESRRKQLEILKNREQDLTITEQELALQRAKMNNTATEGVNKAGLKFKIRERKR